MPTLNAILAGTTAAFAAALVVALLRLASVRRRHDRLDALLRTVESAAFVTFDGSQSSYPIRHLSRSAEDALHCRSASIEGRPAWELFAARDADTMRSLLDARCEPKAGPTTAEVSLARADGTEMPVLAVLLPRSSTRGRDGLLLVVDLSARRRTDAENHQSLAQLQHAEKLKSLEILASGVAHDFNNLLAGVLGNADLALMDLSPLSPARASIDAIKSAAVEACDLTRQMLAYSGRGHFVVELVDLNVLIRSLRSLLDASVTDKAAIRDQLENGLPPIEADVSQLRQLLVSLVTNASDAIGNINGTVTIRTRLLQATRSDLATAYINEDLPEGPYVCLEIADTGCGLDKPSLARVFDPFFVAKDKSRGFGLATVLGIVRSHKGAIRAASVVGEGTTFTILLPASGRKIAQDTDAADAPHPPRATGTHTVLVIDDNDPVRRVADGMLTRLGYLVLTASSGAGGIDVFRSNSDTVDVVMLNMTMPGINGLETLRALRRVRPDVKVVLCTGRDESEAESRFAGEALAGYIQKPFSMERLQGLLTRVLG